MSFTLAIIGRPNVGKSTLFNRLVGKKLAIVDDTPGVTRDRREGSGRLGDMEFTLFDTAGLEEAEEKSLEGRMRQQTDIAINDSDVILFMFDGRVGITPSDEKFAALIRSSNKPVILLGNKMEGMDESAIYEAYRLGLGDPVPISSEHGEGMSDLYSALLPYEEEFGGEAENDDFEWDDPLKPLRIAICGRPNAGKSTLINALIGEDRLLTGPEAGITRDSIGVDWTYHDGQRDWPIKLFDTAGMRRRSKVTQKLEKLSVADSIRAIQFAEVVIIMFDANQALEKQDLHLADLAAREGRGVILVANKWDEVGNRDDAAKALREKAGRLLPQIPKAPLILTSALTGRNLDKIMPAVTKLYYDWNAKIKTSDLNTWLQDAIARHPPPAAKGRRIRIKYIAQTKTRPPTFVAQCQRADELPESYKRYLVNSIRESFDLPAVPIRLYLHTQHNPYADTKGRKMG